MHNIFEGPPPNAVLWLSTLAGQLLCRVHPATNFCLSYQYLFRPVLFTCFSLPLDEIPESSQSFSGYFSLGNNDNTTQATLTSKLWALLQLKSSSLPLLAPIWAWKSEAGEETCPASPPLPLTASSWAH